MTRRFVPVESLSGRRMVGAKGARASNDARISPEIRAHNAEVDRRRAEKKAKKQQSPNAVAITKVRMVL